MAFAGGPAASAQTLPGQPDAAQGEGLAQKVCAVCHIPQQGAPRLQGTADIPTFGEIARKSGQSAERITGAIILPAHPMPQIALTKDQMNDIAAYTMSLKQGGAAKPPKPSAPFASVYPLHFTV